MIRSHFGLQRNPFDPEALALLAHQQEIFFDIPARPCQQQGGLCLVLEPGTGKSVLKQTLLTHDTKPAMIHARRQPHVAHLSQHVTQSCARPFQIEFEGRDHHCEQLAGAAGLPASIAPAKCWCQSLMTPTSRTHQTACANSVCSARTFPVRITWC